EALEEIVGAVYDRACKLRLEGTIEDDLDRCTGSEDQVLATRQENGCGARTGSDSAADAGPFYSAGSDCTDSGAFDGRPFDSLCIFTLAAITLNRRFPPSGAGAACPAKRCVNGKGDAAWQYQRLEVQCEFAFTFHLSGTLDFRNFPAYIGTFRNDDLVI